MGLQRSSVHHLSCRPRIHDPEERTHTEHSQHGQRPGSAHHATLIKHLTALDTTISQMAWITNGISLGLGAATEDFQCTDNEAADVMREIQRYNDVYTHRYPVRSSIEQKPAATSAASPR